MKLYAAMAIALILPLVAQAGTPACGKYVRFNGVIKSQGADVATGVIADFQSGNYRGHDVSVPGQNFVFHGDIVRVNCPEPDSLDFDIENMSPQPNNAQCHLTVEPNGKATGSCDVVLGGERLWSGTMQQVSK